MKALFLEYMGWRIHRGEGRYFAYKCEKFNGEHLHGRTQKEIKAKIREKMKLPRQIARAFRVPRRFVGA